MLSIVIDIKELVELRKSKTIHYDTQFNIRISFEILRKLDEIAEYELRKPSEMVRSWIIEKVHEYERNKRFQKYQAMKQAKHAR